MSASGLVVTYNTTGIFNFAHGAMGMVMAYLFWQLWQGWGLPELVSLAIVLFVGAPLLGVVVERVVMRPLYGAATSIRLAVTLGLLLVLVAAAGAIWSPTANTYNTPESRERQPDLGGGDHPLLGAAHHRGGGHRRGGVPAGVLPADPHRRRHAGRGRRPRAWPRCPGRPRAASPPTPG